MKKGVCGRHEPQRTDKLSGVGNAPFHALRSRSGGEEGQRRPGQLPFHSRPPPPARERRSSERDGEPSCREASSPQRWHTDHHGDETAWDVSKCHNCQRYIIR